MNKDTFCILPWVHTCVRSDNSLKPCCRYDPDEITATSTLDDLYNNPTTALNNSHLISLRETMLSGKWDHGCKKCQTQEDGNITSMRQFMNHRYKSVDTSDIDSQFKDIYYLEMTLDNICNLQCIMCSSAYSSKLQKRDKHFDDVVHKKLEPNFSKFDNANLENLVWIKILGGEPFVSPNFEKFLDYIISRSNAENISLEIATNATVFPNKQLLDKINSFKKVYINVSLDSFDKSNDYQRFGSSYLKIVNNAKKYLTLFDNIHLQFHCTISLLTANTFETMITEIMENLDIRVSFDFVKWPEYLSIVVAPDSYINWLKTQVSHPYAVKLIDSVLKNHKYNESDWNKFLTRIKKNDEFFRIKLEDYNPELHKFLKEHTNG